MKRLGEDLTSSTGASISVHLLLDPTSRQSAHRKQSAAGRGQGLTQNSTLHGVTKVEDPKHLECEEPATVPFPTAATKFILLPLPEARTDLAKGSQISKSFSTSQFSKSLRRSDAECPLGLRAALPFATLWPGLRWRWGEAT